LDPTQAAVRQRLLSTAESSRAWEKVLPIVEAALLSQGSSAAADELALIAELYETKAKNNEHAFELYAQALWLDSASGKTEGKLTSLATTATSTEKLGRTLRMAAACSQDQTRMLELLNRAAEVYEKLGQSAVALDIHQRILTLDKSQVQSLEAMIAHQRQSG